MTKNINYLFTENVKKSHDKSTINDIEHYYKKHYRSNRVTNYTPICAGFLVATLGVILTAMNDSLDKNTRNSLNTLQIIIPVASAFIIKISNSISENAAHELNLLVSFGIKKGIFSKQIPHEELAQEPTEDNEHAIKYQLGLSANNA